jgi:MFS family permease
MVKDNPIKRTETAKSGLFYGYIIALAAFCILLVTYGVRFSYGIFFTPMARELGWNSATTSLAYSISIILEGVFNIIMGGITDKYGPRLVLTLCGILMGLGYCLMLAVNSTWQFFLFYSVIIGIGMGGIFVPLAVIIARWFTARRVLMTGFVMSGAGVGILIMAPLSDHLIRLLSWRETFLALGILTLIVIITAAQFLKGAPAEIGLSPYGENVSGANKAPSKGFSLKEAFRTYQFWFVFLIYALYGFISVSVNIHIVPDAIKIGILPAIAATILATLGGIQIIGRIGLGLLGDHIGNRLVFVIGFILAILALFWIMSNQSTGAFFLFAIIFGLAQGGLSTSQSPLIAGLFGLKSHGLIFGFCGFGYTLGAGLGPYIAGYIFDITGTYDMAFLTCVILSFVGLAMILLLKPIKSAAVGQARL